jgi:uncharacterized protein YdaL
MTCRRLVAAVLLAIPAVVGSARPHAQAPASAQSSARPRALILYDGTSAHHLEGRIDAAHIANLLGHFGFTGAEAPIETYQSGDIARSDVVFVVVGNEDAPPLPPALLRDARGTTHTLVWIGYQLDRFVPPEDSSRRGFSVDGYLSESQFRHVRYKNTVLGKGTGDLARIAVADAARVSVDAVAVDPDGRELPYIVHADHVWAVGDVPFAYVDEEDRYLAFCDVLHEILGVAHAIDRRALIRLEDVTPEDDPADVRRAVDAFVSEGVPFQIALVPIFRDPASGREVTLSDRPALVGVVQDAVKRGGTIVLHGATHQYHGVTPDDFEFWDTERNQPRPDDSAELVHDKLAMAIDECFRNDLYPIAWETPHYTASLLDYREVARVFSTINDRPLTIDLQGTQQFFPYTTVDVRGSLVVPENIGYLPSEKPDPAALVAHARVLLVVRDAVASAYVHDFVDPRRIREVIRGVKALGYTYVSLGAFPSRVTTGSQLVLTRGAHGSLTLDDEYLHEFIVTRDGRRERERYSSTRYRGEAAPTLTPGEGELLVASNSVDRPGATTPGILNRVADFAVGLWAGVRRHSPVPVSQPRPLSVAIVWNSVYTADAWNDQESFRRTFSAYGVAPRLVAREELTRGSIRPPEVLVVPNPSARTLSSDEVAAIGRFVRQGGDIVIDGRSALAQALGLAYTGRTASAGSIIDRAAPEAQLRWRPLVLVDSFGLPRGAVTLARDSSTQAIVAAAFPAGAGHVLYLAAPFDPYTPDGISRYPFLFEHTLETFGREMLARRSAVELYFDPGLRPGVNIEQLAPMWRRVGVRVIYAAAWEFDANYTYDYDRLVRVCHENGLLVYAWFEFPQVSRLFWTHHPEWREVPAAGAALPSWRLAMNLANPACRAAALQFMLDVLGRWPWDGVNLAELNFDGVSDGDAPERSLPMNADVRAEFTKSQGFDPDDLFDIGSSHWWKRDTRGWAAWLQYRQTLVTAWHRDFLTALRPVRESGREVIVTMLDSLEYPRITVDAGVSSPEIIRLMGEFDFTLQVEDPAAAWTDSPRRYERLAERYRALVPAGRHFMFDVNVVPDRRVEATHLPLGAASGTELAAEVRAARAGADRIGLYGDATIRPRDLELVAFALADGTRITGQNLTWSVDAAEAVEVAVPAAVHDFYLEGIEWPYWRPGWVMIPPGHHLLSAYRPWFRLLDLSALRPQVLQVNGSLEQASVTRGRLQFEYASSGRGLALLDRRPQQVSIDDRINVEVVQAQNRTFVLALPEGRHQVEVVGSSRAALLLDLTSIISSSLIVAFGTAACLLLAAFYGGIRIRRFIRSRGY